MYRFLAILTQSKELLLRHVYQRRQIFLLAQLAEGAHLGRDKLITKNILDNRQ
jgi:hypothetical protein